MQRHEFKSIFSINGKGVGKGEPVYIIAEAGVSHFGDEEKAYALVDLAVDAGADAVKFQTFDVCEMIAEASLEWRSRLGPRQLSYDAFRRIKKYCEQRNITFFSTAHDEASLDFLVSLDVPALKVGSGEVGNWPFIERVASQGLPVILSTGMYRQDQIREVLTKISRIGNADIAVLHCVTDYPAAPSDISLGNIGAIRDTFNVVTGYSDHTSGFHIPLAAVACGAKIIEKHITLEYDIPNAQDWKVSCGPDNLKEFIKQVREIEAAMTLRLGGPTNNEVSNMLWAKKSLVLKSNVSKGHVFSADDFVAKRPGTGIEPSRLDEVLGRIAKRNLARDAILSLEDLE